MKKLSYLLALTTLLISCRRYGDDIFTPTKPPVQNPPQNPNPGNPSIPALAIKFRTVMKIGEFVYDSIPGSLMIRSWDNAGQLYTAFQHLTAGTNTLTLPSGRK